MIREQSSCDGGIRQAFQTQLSLSEAAVKTAMQCSLLKRKSLTLLTTTCCYKLWNIWAVLN